MSLIPISGSLTVILCINLVVYHSPTCRGYGRHHCSEYGCLHVKGSRKSTGDACYWVRTGQAIVKITITIYSKDAVFSLDNDHVTFS